VSVEDALRYALCALRNFSSAVSISSPNLAPFASLPLDFPPSRASGSNDRGPEVLEGREDLFFLPRPVVSGPHLLPTAICLLSFSLDRLIAIRAMFRDP